MVYRLIDEYSKIIEFFRKLYQEIEKIYLFSIM
jgi:hypothetical protein